MIQLNQVLHPNTIAVMETLESCSIQEINEKIDTLFLNDFEQTEAKKATEWLRTFPPVLQACHVQEIMGVSGSVAYNLMHHKECPTLKFGHRIVVPREDFWEFVMEHRGKRLW
ncbi:helix-turn-helix domain-containing protein [Chakrabartyella piscis]|uniref:helix-turn-helix domain-containing protein n=1 Tax=Chakrabartyella piscis TaxID=2918914 RepID=UPI002958C923|nr:helix-turn-helix domain-containing protein [Chakrabartyella piscis]